jgi:hypothetical protein
MALFLTFVGDRNARGSQVADLLKNSDTYISDSVNTINDTFGTT